MLSLTGAFSSLGINESSTRKNEKESRNCNSTSLPNLVPLEHQKISLNFVKQNFSSCICDIEISDQPIDFTKKYYDTKIMDNVKTKTKNTFNKVVKSYNNSFTMYAETDLDQPTDYSLRYAEDDSESELNNKIPKNETEFVQDTIKTYCTEDTPYETPFNFSTSTSMSDLRIDEKLLESKINAPTNVIEADKLDKKHCEDMKVKTEFSSGLMTPEKPINFCEEGTPGYFSRVASCGSLNSIPANYHVKEIIKKENMEIEKDKGTRRTVKFEEVVNYAEETPLMFSRSSSLASLDSIEQHSIHDDRSSVVSDFSRLTSGLISPSELPDSPSQTVPPSPRPRKNPITFPQFPKKKKETEPPLPDSENVPKSSVFEDIVKKFKMESTPLEFSTATSLSSLIDDHDEVDTKNTPNENGTTNENKTDLTEDVNNEISDASEDEDILAACINIGMQNNRYSNPKTSSSPPENIVRKTPREIPLNNDMFGQKLDITSDSLKTYCTEGTPAILSHAGSNSDLSILSIQGISNNLLETDRLPIIHKQDQNLSVGSMKNDADPVLSNTVQRDNVEIKNNKDDRSFRSSFSSFSDGSHESEEEALLQNCILAGMPKTNPNINSVANTGNYLNGGIPDESDVLDDNEDDDHILASCINIGMQNNRYTSTSKQLPSSTQNYNFSQNLTNSINSNHASTTIVKLVDTKPEMINDTVNCYFTEDTPAVLSQAGSSSDLSVLSIHGGNSGDYLSDLNSNFTDDDDEDDQQLLAECVGFGLLKVTGSNNIINSNILKNRTTNGGHYSGDGQSGSSVKQTDDLNISLENNENENNTSRRSSLSSLSDSSFESEQALLQECILAGMPKGIKNHSTEDSTELTEVEKNLLQQCILEGMQKCRIDAPNKRIDNDTSELTEADQALLRQCILSGMPKNKNLTLGGPSASRDSNDLTEAERLLLQQCILAGMPKNKSSNIKSFHSSSGGSTKDVSKQWWRKSKDNDKSQGVEHTCCIHCPKNNTNRVVMKQNNHLKSRRKMKDKSQNRDMMSFYVASQIFQLKTDIVDRLHEEWV